MVLFRPKDQISDMFLPPEGKPKIENGTFQTQGPFFKDFLPPEGKPKVENGTFQTRGPLFLDFLPLEGKPKAENGTFRIQMGVACLILTL